MKNKTIIFIPVFFLILRGSVSFAQESMIENIKRIQKHAESTTVLDDILDSTVKMQKEANTNNLDSDLPTQTQKIVSELKNPFTPQLPVKIIPVEKPPTPPPVDVTVEPTEQPLPPQVEEYTPPPVEKPDLKISGLVWNTGKPQAILNGQIVTVGDTIQEWQVTSISKNGVEIQKDDQKFTIEKGNLLETLQGSLPGTSNNAGGSTKPVPSRVPSQPNIIRDRTLSRQQQLPPTNPPTRKTQTFEYKR